MRAPATAERYSGGAARAVTAPALAAAQVEYLRLRALGLTQAECAHRTGRSVRALKEMVSRMHRRLGVASDPEMWALLGWLRVPPPPSES